MTVVIDTNIILDYVLEREGFVQASSDCLERLVINKTKLYLTANTITDIYYITLSHLKNTTSAKEIIGKLLSSFLIIPVDGTDCFKAIGTGIDDYENSVLCICAKKVKADYIITRNTKDFAVSSIKAIAPDDFLKLI